MQHIYGLRRRGDAGLLMRGSGGRAIRQHLGHSPHNHMMVRRGGSIISAPIHTVEHALKGLHIGGGKGARTYIPLKFKSF